VAEKHLERAATALDESSKPASAPVDLGVLLDAFKPI